MRASSISAPLIPMVFALVAAAAIPALAAGRFKIEEATIPELQRAFRNSRLSCRILVQTYLDRIAAYDKSGPHLNAILTLNASALAEADAHDAAFAKGGPVGPLYCVPIVLKDNYNTADLPTTGGSASLAGARPGKDALVLAPLRAARALVLAETHNHEFPLCRATVR